MMADRTGSLSAAWMMASYRFVKSAPQARADHVDRLIIRLLRRAATGGGRCDDVRALRGAELVVQVFDAADPTGAAQLGLPTNANDPAEPVVGVVLTSV